MTAPRSLPVIPVPASFDALGGQSFELADRRSVVVTGGDTELSGVAERFAGWLRRATGFELPVRTEAEDGDIVLACDPTSGFGDEEYTLRADGSGVEIAASTPEGVFRGLTTLRQLLPVAAEATTVQPGPWTIPAVQIRDEPRFSHRGTMLDVARHFFPVDDVLRHIDLAALYKVNRMHLHLTDDQGWRLTVPRRPLLTEVGGPTDIDDGPGGFYTEADFARIVHHAAERYVQIIPEIDLPGHSTTALRAYPDLSCDGQAPPPYHQAGVSTASLCVGTSRTEQFLHDVFDAIVAQSPGPFVHLGADEAEGTPHDDYLRFIPAASELLTERGRRVIAWHEAAQAPLVDGTVIQYWGSGDPKVTGWIRDVVADGHQVILSPPKHAYFDMRYDEESPFGAKWAGFVPVSQSYDWDPGTLLGEVPEEAILGVESALWTETVPDRHAVDFMAFPRVAGIAEAGWAPPEALVWADYRERLAAQGPRWDLLGMNYFRSPEVPWPARAS